MDALKNTVDVPTVLLSELTDIVGAYIPNDVSKQAKRPCKIFIDGGRLATDRTDNALRMDKDFSIKILGKIGGNAEFALLDTPVLHYYSAVNVKMPCSQLGDTFEMQLLTESVLDEARYKETVEEIFEYYVQKNFDDDIAKVVLFTVVALKDSSYFDKTIKVLFENAKIVDDKIGIILKLNNAFTKNAEWKNYFVSTAKELFEEEDVDTIGGVVLKVLGRIAQVNDSIEWKNLTLTVKEIDGVRITKLLVVVREPFQVEEETEEEAKG